MMVELPAGRRSDPDMWVALAAVQAVKQTVLPGGDQIEVTVWVAGPGVVARIYPTADAVRVVAELTGRPVQS